MLFLQFVALQIADVFTTLVFLRQGVSEANPLVRWTLQAGGSPAAALVATKALAILIAWAAWYTGRRRALRIANAAFAGCVLWNFAAIAWSISVPRTL